MEILYLSLALQLVLIGYQSIKLRNLKKNISKAQDKYFSLIKKNDIRIHEIYLSLERWFEPRRWPDVFRDIPLADQTGIILSTQKLEIPLIEAPHNGSLIEIEEGYLLIFRFDTPLVNSTHISYVSQIGSIALTRDFTILKDTFSVIQTGSLQSEDARIFQNSAQFYLLLNEPDLSCQGTRKLRLGAFELKERHFKGEGFLKWSAKQVEKNWTPFSYQDEIYFLYTISPQKILRYGGSANGELKILFTSVPQPGALKWSEKWGMLRGGTPAQEVEGQYLAFFHSSFEDRMGIKWYVMGAYTFENKPPFRMTKISSDPLLFEGIYETKPFPTAHPGVRSIYPMGFVRRKTKTEDAIHLSCGENDSAVKIVTFDTKRLLESLGDCC